jgi:short-subunit dehydrogenase
MFALITGASSGIGRAMAFELAKKNYSLILVARRESELKQIKAKIEESNKVEVIIKVMDVSSVKNCEKLHEETQTYQPEIIINNAGFGQVGRFDEIDLGIELKMIETNIIAVHTLTKLFVRSMKKGIILNVASIAGMLPTPLMASYSASKAYVLNFSRAINCELRKSRSPIKVLTLNPGPVVTEFGKVANTKQKMQGMSADKCAKIAIRDMLAGKKVIVPGVMMKITRFFFKT